MTKIDRVELVSVIRVKYAIGKGTEDDPVREVIEYWTQDGKKIAKLDKWEMEK